VAGPKVLGKIDLDAPKQGRQEGRSRGAGTDPAPSATWPARCLPPRSPAPPAVPAAPVEPETIRVNVQKLTGVKTVGKIELPVERERKPSEQGPVRQR
jgi:hypothetical protein